jgi:hypothetical protein
MKKENLRALIFFPKPSLTHSQPKMVKILLLLPFFSGDFLAIGGFLIQLRLKIQDSRYALAYSVDIWIFWYS